MFWSLYCCLYSAYWTEDSLRLVEKSNVHLPTPCASIELTEYTLFSIFHAPQDSESTIARGTQGGGTQEFATHLHNLPLWYWIYWYKVTFTLRCHKDKQCPHPFRWEFIPICQLVTLLLWLYFRGLGREGWRKTYTHTHKQSLADYLSVLCLLCSVLHCRLFGSKQWNHSPLSLSLIRRRIWGEWELTCEQRRADCDYSAAGALNRCWLCLLLHSGRAAHLLGHSGAEEQAAATVIISLHFTLDVALLLIEILQTAVSV